MRINALFPGIPYAFRANFFHLVMDIAWWGVFNGSAVIFLPIFATRLGASAFQIGILTAIPAAMNILLAFPAGLASQRYPLLRANLVVAVLNRLLFIPFILLPFFLQSDALVLAILLNMVLMNIPGACTGILGPAFLGECVPPNLRAQTVGIRFAALAAVTMLTSLLCGQILNRMPFPLSYQVVFFIGFLGASLSVIHLARIRSYASLNLPGKELELAAPLPAASGQGRLWLGILKGPFGRLLGILFFSQFSLNLAASLAPLYLVRSLALSDGVISLGSAIFWVLFFFSSILSGRLSGRLSLKSVTSLGIILVALSTILFAYSFQLWIYVICQVVSGLGWGLLTSGQFNYVLARTPAAGRTSYLTWYNLAMNLALLAGALLGPLMAGRTGLLEALLVVAALRFIAGLAIQKWG
ncbi:MAG: MFS transporter [Chloroflexi bacterium]|nr:MFS transporter [Chloroflexota bacterium]